MMDYPQQPVFRRNKVGVKDGDELARRRLQPFRQRSGLEPFSVIAVVIGDGVAPPGVFTHEARAHDLGLVSRIVEHLDFQELPRVVDASDSLEQPLDHVALVIHRQLDGDARQALESLPRLGKVAAVLEVETSQIVAMHAINRKDDQNGKVRNQDREVRLRPGIADDHIDQFHIGIWCEPRPVGVGIANCRRQPDPAQAGRQSFKPGHG